MTISGRRLNNDGDAVFGIFYTSVIRLDVLEKEFGKRFFVFCSDRGHFVNIDGTKRTQNIDRTPPSSLPLLFFHPYCSSLNDSVVLLCRLRYDGQHTHGSVSLWLESVLLLCTLL